MTERAYLRPVGRVTLCPDPVVATADDVVRIADRNDLLFMGVELLVRQSGGVIDRRMLSHNDARTLARQAAPLGSQVAALLHRLATARTPVAGLTFDRPRLMGIVNVTPDSFSDGNKFIDAHDAISPQFPRLTFHLLHGRPPGIPQDFLIRAGTAAHNTSDAAPQAAPTITRRLICTARA